MANITFETIPTDKPKHQAPQDCQSKGGVTCDICFAPMPVVGHDFGREPTEVPEHPAIRAAKMIRQLHLDTIAQINTGFVYYKKLENGDTQSCNQEMVEACMAQIALCNEIIEKAETLPPELLKPIEFMLVDAKQQIENSLSTAAEVKPDEIPEIGNYDHKETE